MWLLDQWAERHILEAQRKGEFNNLPGNGQPLVLDDDSFVPAELRSGYRLLKNAGCLPSELEYRKDALALNDLLNSIEYDDPMADELRRRLMLIELKLQQAGVNTDFLRGQYSDRLFRTIKGDQACTASENLQSSQTQRQIPFAIMKSSK
ncbi:hypothetical protein C3709_23105 [Lelliottia aquatilis]|uniref:DnaJ homologue subfamily C member 28 conserved domain-containing protein n=1 Tax=Lelliottia aquatilis TaxID=2080838 RepID=A0ABX4ZXM4_9ENTR|nr:DUF1992 domain-containing protein [Lelliottia aquatilis]POZ14815.1 hypothetical protein C3708_23060 [Lelliottia sp. 7254-16]POZ17861.1 hypothetical protein C3712_23110 [Lelliottia aquatilis]POZ20233.1 hypothetical protein C3711_23110 [Lelliottia aquatilis]POZ30433.1 hypothetical protein C3710_23065 [Lelliottia aquatilis]